MKLFRRRIKALCPQCLAPLPIHFACHNAGSVDGPPDEPDEWVNLVPTARVPYITNLVDRDYTSSLCGLCQSCGSLIKDWELYMLHPAEVMVSIEESLDNPPFIDYSKTWDTGTLHKKIKGGEHYSRKPGKKIQYWFRWGYTINPETIPQHLTEQIDYIWIDKEMGSSQWQKTTTLLNYIRKQLKEITFGYIGSSGELRAGSIGIQESKIDLDISLLDFIEKHSTHS